MLSEGLHLFVLDIIWQHFDWFNLHSFYYGWSKRNRYPFNGLILQLLIPEFDSSSEVVLSFLCGGRSLDSNFASCYLDLRLQTRERDSFYLSQPWIHSLERCVSSFTDADTSVETALWEHVCLWLQSIGSDAYHGVSNWDIVSFIKLASLELH